jgi:peptidyl-prolyl cis-trans isomerase-like protein 2
LHDPITYKVFSPHIHIVFLKNTGNVFDMNSLQLLAIKPKTWRDLVSDEPFERKDIITIQDPKNLVTRDLRDYDYVKKDKKVTGERLAGLWHPVPQSSVVLGILLLSEGSWRQALINE